MSDIKKMPRIIYVAEYEYAPGGLEIVAVKGEVGVKYIRADTVEEEIRIAEEFGYSKGYCNRPG